jgi:quercetin dioxygenase-like cupin family protein
MEDTMYTANLNTLELMHGHFDDDQAVDFRANFALVGGQGAEGSSMVYVELEPGKALGEHTDSPEEVLLVLEGTVEFSVGGETARATKGMIGVVPPMVPHGFRNAGEGIAKVVGFFPAPGVVATFIEPVQPLGVQEMVFGQVEVPA